MANVKPVCRPVTVVTFRGDRRQPFAGDFRRKQKAAKIGGPDLTISECLRFAGHTGISLDSAITIFGFNPQSGGKAVWQVIDDLEHGRALQGIVSNDTAEFVHARALGLAVLRFDVLFPDRSFQEFERVLEQAKNGSSYMYGFPDGDGDCNCTTWLERIGLPLLTGRMKEFVNLNWIAAYPRRRFGDCVP